ncbi:gliding motility protein RemB [Sphingobacterium bovistauri]|uniref:Gliding motility protein RemB n=1 Tax=Sphingobacterium bovistauri TaxID=2781959 RepID=A0ABS7ZC35_9SPHI|nr:gliding motility protein RemB [Sphingobacterium bovistauri]MCA5006489.1 gliding motility protein RemB [Sphingobacterium bovistauri]
MRNKKKYIVVGLVFTLVFVCNSLIVKAQVENEVYSYEQSTKYNNILYNVRTRFHTSSKPFLFKNELLNRKDSLEYANSSSSTNFIMRKLFNEHLVDVEKEDHSFYLDFLPDFQIGSELIDNDNRSTWLNTRGIQAGLTIKDRFTFYTSLYENQGVFANYLDQYIAETGVVPGQSSSKNPLGKTKDWMYATASLTYDFSPYFQLTAAFDKNHIGDGYRSLLLSDFSSNYTQLKFTGEIGNVQYTSVWAYMNDPVNPRLDSLNSGGRFGDGIKYGAFQYIDYNATNRLSVGFFQAVVWANRNQAGHRGFDFNYLNPGILFRPVENNNRTSPDKMFLGLNAKYKVLNNITAYGQFLLGEFTAKEFFANNGYAHNKWGTQLGVRGFDMFGVQNLHFLAEYNLVRPYTYQHFASISNYSNNGEPLAHPRGANFREFLGTAQYTWNRFEFNGKAMISSFGTDPNAETNMGGDIFQPYTAIPNMYGNKIGQGVKNNLYFADLRASYVLNPKYNLRLELGYTQRYRRIEGEATQKSGVINFGLRSSFRNFYGDI